MTKLSLHKVLKNGYEKDKEQRLNGYILDKSLSNDTHQTYYHPQKKKLLYNVRGTASAGDWITDAKLLVGRGFKESDRYKDAHKGLRDAKQKYKTDSAAVVGHSLGGQIANYIAGGKDKVITLNKAATFGSSLKGGTHYRTQGDIVSSLDIGKTHMKTLPNENKGEVLKTLGKATVAIASENPVLGVAVAKEAVSRVLDAHKVDNLKDKPIFV
jgi:dienelactone hydrolase